VIGFGLQRQTFAFQYWVYSITWKHIKIQAQIKSVEISMLIA